MSTSTLVAVVIYIASCCRRFCYCCCCYGCLCYFRCRCPCCRCCCCCCCCCSDNLGGQRLDKLHCLPTGAFGSHYVYFVSVASFHCVLISVPWVFPVFWRCCASIGFPLRDGDVGVSVREYGLFPVLWPHIMLEQATLH